MFYYDVLEAGQIFIYLKARALEIDFDFYA